MRAVGDWLFQMRKIGVGVIPVIVLWTIPEGTVPFGSIQLVVAAATLPVAVLFIVAYTPERPHRHWFGSSLLLLAWAVAFYSTSAVLLRVLGDDYWARSYMVKASVALAFVAMVMRTCVLLGDQIQDRRGVGWWLARAFRLR